MPNRLCLTSGIASRPREQAGSLRMELLGGQVIVKVGLVAQTAALDILGDANDVCARHGVGVDLHALADRFPAGPEPVGHRLAHHHGSWCLRDVLRADTATAKDAGA